MRYTYISVERHRVSMRYMDRWFNHPQSTAAVLNPLLAVIQVAMPLIDAQAAVYTESFPLYSGAS
jgi:hypothetical protein